MGEGLAPSISRMWPWERPFEQVRSYLNRTLLSVLSPTSYGAVFYRSIIAKGVFEADAFWLLIRSNDIGPWQEIECEIALERNLQDSCFTMVPVLAPAAKRPRYYTWQSLTGSKRLSSPILRCCWSFSPRSKTRRRVSSMCPVRVQFAID